MQSRSFRNVQLAAMLAAAASAQTITSTIPVCPATASTTITIPTTVTFCPGPHCNGGGSGPQITAGPNGVGRPGINVGQYTSVGPDGKTTVLGIWETVYDSLCESGLVPATYTITQPCPCEATPHPTALPTGFERTVVPCNVCGPHSTVTLTQPVATGPYAAQTPTTGQANAAANAGANAIAAGPGGAAASAGASANAQAGPNVTSANAASAGSAQAGPNGASANAAAAANAQTGPNAVPANAQVGPNGAAAGSPAGANLVAGLQGTKPMNGTAPASNGTRPITNAPIQSFVSSASHISTAVLSILMGITASFLL